MKKIIGITSNFVSGGEKPMYNGEIYSYFKAVEDAGALPIMIPIYRNSDNVEEIIDKLDGIVLSGGNDIHPYMYKADPHPKLDDVSLSRDMHEAKIYKLAKEKGLNILGICRGMQLINVLEGGDLYQDIYTEYENVIGHSLPDTVPDFHHKIHLDKEGILRDIFGQNIIYVNSIHHQAIKNLGQDLKILARASDGIIEGIQHESKKIYAVQFHPEELYPRDEKFLEIFKRALEV